MAPLRTSEQTHRRVLPQPTALESTPADTPQGRDETGRGRRTHAATGMQHGRGETCGDSTCSRGRHPHTSVCGDKGRKAPHVFVLDRNGLPLQPCHPARARQLLAAKRAVIHRHTPLVIRLKDRTVAESSVAGVKVGVDPGSKYTGIALFTTAEEETSRRGVSAIEIAHRGVRISLNMTSRAARRRGRRTRNLRYRALRFSNRTKPTGWLAPSLRHRVEGTMSWIGRLRRWAPITAVHVERVAFDTQALQNPNIGGVEYQQGTLHGYEVREYLLAKWQRRCAYCGVTDVPLNIDHIHPRSRGGTHRVSNLTMACIPCNQRKGNEPVEEFLAGKPAVLARIVAQAKTPLRDAAAVSATRWALWRALIATRLPVYVASGGRTKWNRHRTGAPKTHTLDALHVGVLATVTGRPDTVLVAKSTGRGAYQRTRTDRFGFPRLLLPRTKTVHGFATGDLVRAVVPTGKRAGSYTGRVAVRTKGTFNIHTSHGLVQGIHHRHVRLLQRGDGWSYTRQEEGASSLA